MNRISILCCLGLIAPACSQKKDSVAKTTKAQEGSPVDLEKPLAHAPVPEGTHLLLPIGTQLYSSKDASESIATVDGAQVEVFRIIFKDGEWIEVESVPYDGLENGLTTCHNGHWWDADDLTLRAFVHTSDAAKVVRQQTRFEFDDKSHVELMPGVLVTGGPTDTQKVFSHRVGFAFALPRQEIVGTSFVPGKPIPRPNTPSVNFSGYYSDTKNYTQSLEGLKVKAGTYAIQQEWETMRITQSEDPGPLMLKGFGRCIAVQGYSDRLPVEEKEQPPRPLLRKKRLVFKGVDAKGNKGSFKLPLGTKVFWKDGKAAGTVRKEFYLNTELSAEREGLRCTTVGAALEVCFPTAAIELSP